MRLWGKKRSITLGTHSAFFLPLPYSLSDQDLLAHQHVIGISGSGKSRFLACLFLELERLGLPATLIDPHGDLARLVLGHLVERGVFADRSAFSRIIYLDIPRAARDGRFLPFNVLADTTLPHTTAANVLEAFHRAWPSLAGGNAATFDTLVQNGAKVLLSNKLPLPRLYRMLTDKEYRDALLSHEDDPDVVSVFHHWFDRLPARDQADQAGATLRRVNLLTFDPVLKYSLGQEECLVDFGQILRSRSSLIVNLALASGEARRLLGCLLTVFAEQAALSQADLDPAERSTSHHLIIDEFSEFTAQSEEALSRMLSQTRKFGLFLVMAHQTWSQASERLRGALQNVGIDVAFRLGRQDAQVAAGVFGRVDPMVVKHTIEDEQAQDRSHPVFYSLPEQWETVVQNLQYLKPRMAYIRRPSGSVAKIHTRSMPDSTASPDALAAVEEHYLKTCFVSAERVQHPRQDEALNSLPSAQTQRVVPLKAAG